MRTHCLGTFHGNKCVRNVDVMIGSSELNTKCVCLNVDICRTFSSRSPNSPQPEVKPPSTLRAYIVRKYVEYITRFDATFERSYPKIYKVYKLFKDGNSCVHLIAVTLLWKYLFVIKCVSISGCFYLLQK